MSTLAFITGANKGIGFEVARQLGATGIIVLIGARDKGRADAAVAALKKDGINAHAVEIDVSNEASVIAAAKKVGEDHGRIDILVNNAGIMQEMAAGTRPKDLTLETLKQTFDTNVFGAFAVIKHFVPLLKKSRAPRIINVSSTLGSLTAMSDRAHPMPRRQFRSLQCIENGAQRFDRRACKRLGRRPHFRELDLPGMGEDRYGRRERTPRRHARRRHHRDTRHFR